MRLLLLSLLILLSQNDGIAQSFELGLGVSLGRTFVPEKSNPAEIFEKQGSISTGFMIPLKYRISKNFDLISGFTIQRKTYKIRHNEYDFPNLKSSGSNSFGVKSNVFQVPLLLSARVWSKGDQSLFIRAGLAYARYKASVYTGSSDWSPSYKGNDTFIYVITSNTPFDSYAGIELLAGINYSFRAKEGPTHEFGMTAEYSTFEGPGLDYRINLSNDTQGKEYMVNERAKLLLVKFSYVRYFNFKSKKG